MCAICVAKVFYFDNMKLATRPEILNLKNQFTSGFNQKTILNIHMKSKAHNADYKTVYKKKKLGIANSHNITKRDFRCQLCVPSAVFATAEERMDHRNAMHRKYECDICKNSFMTQESLDSHKLLHSDKPRPFVCKVSLSNMTKAFHYS